jgi:spermidine synthase
MHKSSTGTNLFLVGFISSSFQFLLIREMMNIAGGYELITGVFLTSWLTISAIGAFLAGKFQITDFKKINLFFSFSLILTLLFLFLLSRLLLETGQTPSFLISVIFTFIIIMPICLASGFAIVKLMNKALSENLYTPGKSYSIETAGGIISGMLISLLTSGILTTYKLLLLIITLSFTYYLIFFCINRKVTMSFALIISFTVSLVIIFTEPDIFFRQMLLPGIKVTSTKDTPYGNITKGIYSGEKSLYYNQRLLFYNSDITEREEDIHYAMLQSSEPQNIIVVSGNLVSHLSELEKYHINKLTYLELDPLLIQTDSIPKKFLSDKLNIINTDGFSYLKKTVEKADVIIILLPAPATLMLNRFYTTEFFKIVKEKLNNNGILMITPGPADDYMNNELVNMYSSILNSMTEVFRSVRPVLGNKMYFIASDKNIDVEFCKLAEEKGIKNIYVGPYYLSDDITEKRTNEITSQFNRNIRQNRYSFPISCFYYQSYKISKGINDKIPSAIILTVMIIIPLLSLKLRNLPMYLSASALSGFEIILLLIIQLLFGNIYQLTSLVIAGIMTGLAIGATSYKKLTGKLSFKTDFLVLIIFYLCAALAIGKILTISCWWLSAMVIFVLVLVPSVLTGHIFSFFTLNSVNDTSLSSVYVADLAGAATGFIFTSVVLIPSFGLIVSVIILSLLILTGFLFGTVGNKL